MDEPAARWMTYRELAEELGVSLRAAEARARRHVKAGKWRHRVDNDPPNAARVLVPPADLEMAQGSTEGLPAPLPRGRTQEDTGTPTGGDTAAQINALLAELKASHERETTELRRRADSAEADATGQRERAAKAEGQGAAVARERDRAEAQRDEARAELAAWTAGGPFARAVRAFLNRRGRS